MNLLKIAKNRGDLDFLNQGWEEVSKIWEFSLKIEKITGKTAILSGDF
jgi:hypothetical protein